MLVVTAVVAVFIVKNQSYTLSNSKDGIGLIQAGWPYSYLVGWGFLNMDPKNAGGVGDPFFAADPKYNQWAVVLNIAICGIASLTTSTLVWLILRRSQVSDHLDNKEVGNSEPAPPKNE